jgi:hydroxyacylglutathione hydrolase
MIDSSRVMSLAAPNAPEHRPLNLTPLPAFADNYLWLLDDGRHAAVVDPGDAAVVSTALQARGLELAAILVTHHHADHTGGVDALRARLTADGAVWGPARERIPQPFVPLADGDEITVLGRRFRVLDVPGHTAGHIAYVEVDGPGRGFPARPLLFCGDTLFSAGCGRLFEGTPAQMSASLARLAQLPADTRVCCTHEYTLSNLRFAAAVEPDNAALARHRLYCEAERAAGRPTLPSSIALELEINPFLRCREPAVVRAAQARGAAADEVSVMAALRTWKDEFR